LRHRFFITVIFLWAASFGALNSYAASTPLQTTDIAQETTDKSDEVTTGPSFNAEDFETAFRRLKSQDHLQFELASAPEAPTFEWLQKILKAIGRMLLALAPFFKILFWAFVICLAALIIYIFVNSVMAFRATHRERREQEEELYAYRPTQAQALILLQEVDALAAQGRYGEAVHKLLFRSIQDIGTAKPNMIRRSLTSREIADIPSLAPDTRHAFTLIAAEVERSHFGGQSLDKAAFERCRSAYAKFAQPQKTEEILPTTFGAVT